MSLQLKHRLLDDKFLFPFDINVATNVVFILLKCFTSCVIQTAPPSPGLHGLWTEPPPAPTGTPSNMSQYFDLYDVKESSYHTFISRLDLHICNDSSSVDEG